MSLFDELTRRNLGEPDVAQPVAPVVPEVSEHIKVAQALELVARRGLASLLDTPAPANPVPTIEKTASAKPDLDLVRKAIATKMAAKAVGGA